MISTHRKGLRTALLGTMTFLGMSATLAAEMDHSPHTMHQPPASDHEGHAGMQTGYATTGGAALTKLDAIPASGKAREAGFDDRYVMEPTSARYDIATQCAHGSRGLIMLDNATWERCGGKPKGASKGPGYYPPMFPWYKDGTGKTHSMDHSQMGH